ncbi:MAG: NAD(P)H-dependent oxidoreductase [Pseudomonadota bacterium]
MTTILRIDSSSRAVAAKGSETEGSFSRALADRVVTHLADQHPGASIIERDLIANPIDHIADETIKGYYTAPEDMSEALKAATAQSDTLIAELKAADTIVISAPIYNFSVPSALKAWIDQIIRIGHTFSYEDGAFVGLVSDRPTYLVLSYGAAGYAPGGPLEAYDFLRPYLTGLMNFIGLTSVEVIVVEATTAPDAQAHLAKANADVDARFAWMAA